MTREPPSTTGNPGSAATKLAQEIKRLRHAAEWSQPRLAEVVGYTRQYVSLAERVGQNLPSLDLVRALDAALNANGTLLALREQAKDEQQGHRARLVGAEPHRAPGNDNRATSQVFAESGTPLIELDQVELLRQGLNDALSAGAMSDASLDDWDRTVIAYGRATRHRAADALLADLSIDMAELKRAIDRYRSARALRHLTRVAAHMSGLMCLKLCKLDNRPAFRKWTYTARSAAHEAGEPATSSWVLAQEAYGHYYSGDLPEAIAVARHAQDMVSTTRCVGSALAAALEARAYASMGRGKETREALDSAEDTLSCLRGEELSSSAFGYSEAQLRFHEENAYTSLHDMPAAFKAQDQALRLCVPGDYTDWSMIRLDRAICLVRSGDIIDGVSYAIETFTELTESQRRGIIAMRGHEILDSLRKSEQALPVAKDLRELIMITT